MKPQAKTILAMLRDRPEGVSGMDALREAGVYRLASRINELRAVGFDITTDKTRGYGVYRLHEQLELPL